MCTLKDFAKMISAAQKKHNSACFICICVYFSPLLVHIEGFLKITFLKPNKYFPKCSVMGQTSVYFVAVLNQSKGKVQNVPSSANSWVIFKITLHIHGKLYLLYIFGTLQSDKFCCTYIMIWVKFDLLTVICMFQQHLVFFFKRQRLMKAGRKEENEFKPLREFIDNYA